jgi:hypothetical protein
MKVDDGFSGMRSATIDSGSNLNIKHSPLAPVYTTFAFTFDNGKGNDPFCHPCRRLTWLLGECTFHNGYS